MILTARDLDAFDRCPRRFAFEQQFSPRTISPLGLLYAAVEASLTANDPSQGSKDAILDVTSRLEVASNDLSPLSTVHHVEMLSEIISIALRARYGRAKRIPDVALDAHQWRSNLFELKSGDLHRIILTSDLNDDSLRSFAHSWLTIGELAALERPLTLTVIIIGASRGGRRHSPWTKAFQHPIQKSALRFKRKKAEEGFTDKWKEVWREQTEIKAETWLERMKTDDVFDDLIASRGVRFRGDDNRMIQARREMIEIADLISTARTDAPMRRSSCDEIGRGACPFQNVCYHPNPVTPADFPHLYSVTQAADQI